MKQVTISITDDDPIWLKTLLYSIEGLKIAEKIKPTLSGLELIAHSQLDNIDIAIIDYKMPVLDGLHTALILRENNFKGRIIIVSSGFSSKVEAKLSQFKIDGYFEKRIPIIKGVILKVMNNECINNYNDFPSWEYRTIRNNLNELDIHYIDTILNKREKALIKFAAKGYNNSQIASEVMVSEKTVESYFTKLYDKLKMDRKKILIWATLSGLTDSESFL